MSNEGTAYNRAYLASVIAFAKIPTQGTSDTLGTLSAIAWLIVRCENGTSY